MPSFGDSAFIFILALLLFGPKKLPELARQLGKLMAEFRRASNEFRMQMDEELRVADQAEQQRKIAAMEAAAPVAPPIGETAPELSSTTSESEPAAFESATSEIEAQEPLPIASNGDLSLMPPDTGLPLARQTETPEAHTGNEALSPILETIPHAADPATHINNDPYLASHTSEPTESSSEAPLHG